MFVNSGSAACHLKANNQGARVGRKESLFFVFVFVFFQKNQQSEKKVDLCPETNSDNFAQS